MRIFVNQRSAKQKEKFMFDEELAYTGYEVAMILNLRPQMIYQYMKKGYIATIQHNEQNLVSGAVANEFAEKRANASSKSRGQRGIRIS